MDVGKAEIELLDGVEEHVGVVSNLSAIESIAELQLIVLYGSHCHAVIGKAYVDILVCRDGSLAF